MSYGPSDSCTASSSGRHHFQVEQAGLGVPPEEELARCALCGMLARLADVQLGDVTPEGPAQGLIRVHVYEHESLTRHWELSAPVPYMVLDLPAALHAYDRIGFAEDDPEPFAARVLEVQRVTWFTAATDDGAWAEVHVRETTR